MVWNKKDWDDLSPGDEEFLQSLDNIDDEAVKNSIIGYTTWMNKQFKEQLKDEIAQAKLDEAIDIFAGMNGFFRTKAVARLEGYTKYRDEYLQRLTKELKAAGGKDVIL